MTAWVYSNDGDFVSEMPDDLVIEEAEKHPDLIFFYADLMTSEEVSARIEEGVKRDRRKAQKKWQLGEWANAPHREDRIANRMAMAQHATDWLRRRIDEEVD